DRPAVVSAGIRPDAARHETRHEPSPELVRDLVLVERLRLEADANQRGAVGNRLDAGDVDRRKRQRPAFRGVLPGPANLGDGRENAIEMLAVRDTRVDDGV